MRVALVSASCERNRSERVDAVRTALECVAAPDLKRLISPERPSDVRGFVEAMDYATCQ